MWDEFVAGPKSAPARATCTLVGGGRFYHCAIPAFLIEFIISGCKRHKVSHYYLRPLDCNKPLTVDLFVI